MSAEYPQTGSTLTSSISASLSTQIVIKVANDTVGAVQQLTVSQNRPLYRIGEIGMDGTLEIGPQNRTVVSLEVNRMAFDRLRLAEAFARGFLNIKSQRLPFDILVIDRTLGDGENAITHMYINCWFERYSTPYQANDYLIAETATIQAEDVSSRLGSSANVAQGGARDMKPQIEDRERRTDRGEFRGTMDAAGIATAAFQS